MLAAVGVASLDELFKVIPDEVRYPGLLPLPPALSEPELMAHVQELASRNLHLDNHISFLGAGIYDHYVPPVVDFISSRSEFYTSYTPYQAEASQGSLQVFFEYQSLICKLTGMDVANASLYDGATALTESVLMAMNLSGRDDILESAALHPEDRQTLETYLRHMKSARAELTLNGGRTDPAGLEAALESRPDTGVVVVQQPNFFGVVEDVSALAQATHRAGALLVVKVNPIALGLLKSPGECGADIACGEGQCLGIHPSFGGPGLGLLATRAEYVRKMPGRLVGVTQHSRGDRAYVLTLQTREQHIRRERATSNICTNHALLALRATVYLCALGRQGLRQVATLCVQKAHDLADRLRSAGVPIVFSSPFFHEFAVDCGRPAQDVVQAMLERGYLAGVSLGRWYPDRRNALLLSVTEQRTAAQIQDFARKLAACIRSC
ncbi:MAG: aminomethyl-transferring glycine dehydrogenase subunit GcvPA [Planctomycetes bacterium]|nr:aminomethyl-transferring glycine dehydrogenase subunit GcvPA [Planctomycetota bacterium]